MIFILLIILVILITATWIRSKPFFWKGAGIPYHIPLPFFGSTISSFYKPFYVLWLEMYNKNARDSSGYGFHFFGIPTLLVADPALVKEITTTKSDHFMSHGLHPEENYDPIGRGIFLQDGEEWKLLRSKMTPFFSPTRIKSMFHIISPTSERFTRYLAEEGKKGSVEVNSACLKFTVDVIMSTIFGLEPECFEKPDSFFYHVQKEMFSFRLGLKISIGIVFPDLYKKLRLTVLTGSSTSKMTRFVEQVLKQRQKGIGNRPDILQGMLELMEKENSKDGTKYGKFDRFTVVGQCITMYAAGTETTGNSLSFILYELALHPEVQDKARAEIRCMIQKAGGNYGLDDLNGLKYVHMIIKESLRKYPPLPAFARKCTKVYDFNGFKMPVGTHVMFAPIALQNDPRYFPDPDKFMPERFEDESTIIPGSYMPFGMGPRTCLGMKMAEAEIILSLCKLLSTNRVSVCSKTEIPLRFSMNPTLSPKNGIWLDIKNINY